MKNLCYINLVAIKENALKIKSLLPSGVKFNAVVKADGYGHGMEMVASALHPIVDGFSVSIVEEGVALRNCGIDKEILTLIPPRDEDITRALEYDISLAVDSLALLKTINSKGKKIKKVALIHIKYDTGMNRLGVKTLSRLEEILTVSKGLKWIKIVGLFSHFADSQDKMAVKKATDKFLLAIRLVRMYNSKVTCHISASGGFLRGEYFDMVRIGLLLYGYKPFRSTKLRLAKAMKIYALTLSSFTIKKGESALYGKKIADRAETLSLIRYGYADGQERRETEEIFNNRCMDVTAVRKRIKGKKYLLLNNADRIAKTYNTISYEILVKSAIRAEKIYIN